MLLEVLVAVLIFAIGVLSIVGLQVNSIKQSSASKYRTDASLLADDVIGKMWITDRSNASLTAFATGGAQYNSWLASVQATLPGVAANAPQIVVAADNTVTVTVSWKAPNEPATDPVHNLTLVTRIR
jgi:type IV pilus assembly protein PilV